jgi:hypothetical protein
MYLGDAVRHGFQVPGLTETIGLEQAEYFRKAFPDPGSVE